MTLTLTPETEARLQTLAAQRNEAPEAVVDAALKAMWQDRDESAQDETAQEANKEAAYQAEQARLHALMDDLLAKAHEIVPEPYDSQVRTYYRESEVGKIIAEKFRKQGFNV